MNELIRFGPAGAAKSYYARGYKGSAQIARYLSEFRLTAFEYQCGRGVKITQPTAEKLGSELTEKNIKLSLHAPYYISLSSIDDEKRLKSVDYIFQAAQAAFWLGGDRIVVHSGSASKITREQALELAKNTVLMAQKHLDENGLGGIRICLETMGKVGQLGSFDEVMSLCECDERILPCIDFGHLNARTFGGIKSKADYENLIKSLKNRLGSERGKNFHVHFSKIQYTNPGGEKIHLTFEDTMYGPEFEPLLEVLAKHDCTPTIICESAGTQTEDALTMMNYYDNLL